ncbi:MULTISPECIES: hypothetical protein [unclassified Thiocapsa]|uniref:hypothetical protein n=1 Tax=unclassified Thiocapsa TaxID=2641286 RepID=UPI0035B4065A
MDIGRGTVGRTGVQEIACMPGLVDMGRPDAPELAPVVWHPREHYSMNCRDFRRRLLVDPAREDADTNRHAAHCPACAAERAHARAFEEMLRAALLAEEGMTGSAHGAGSSSPFSRNRVRLT